MRKNNNASFIPPPFASVSLHVIPSESEESLLAMTEGIHRNSNNHKIQLAKHYSKHDVAFAQQRE